MFEPVEISSGKRTLRLESPIMNAAGTLGFSEEAGGLLELTRLGCFITSPLSRRPRSPASDSSALPFEGGLLLHTGHPNPGISQALHRYRRRWDRLGTPVVVHLIGESVSLMEEMILRLEREHVVEAVEIGLMESDRDILHRIGRLAKQAELPVIPRLPLHLPSEIFIQAAAAGVPALSFGPPRGQMISSTGSAISGRLYGPSLFPLAIEKLSRIQAEIDIPIIAGGGVTNRRDVEIMLNTGAAAVQLDTALWAQPERMLSKRFLGEDD